LTFEHASRAGVAQSSNSFAINFNGKRIKEYFPTDYNVNSASLSLDAVIGKNTINFIGTGTSDSLGQGIDNVALKRDAYCGVEDVIVNGGFEQGHNLGHGWSIFANGKIPGWIAADNQI